MPSIAHGVSGNRRPDFVLGDRYGTSCHALVTHRAKLLLEELGYSVLINKPYAGGFITEHYGRPQSGLHAIQIEINRGLYMDEASISPSVNFDSFTRDLELFLSKLVELKDDQLTGSTPLAAE